MEWRQERAFSNQWVTSNAKKNRKIFPKAGGGPLEAWLL
jgi:hypothetical protein